MPLITEKRLREKYGFNLPQELYIDKDTKLTPAAKEFLNQNHVKLIKGDKVTLSGHDSDKEMHSDTSDGKDNVFPFQLYMTDARIAKKPETMTAIFGNQLVYKDHPRIKFRGLCDSLESETLYSIGVFRERGNLKISKGLKELYGYMRLILRAEVLGEELGDFSLLGYGADEVRQMTHNPKKAFGKGHFFLQGDESIEVFMLNRLRAKSRELELSAYPCFRVGEEYTRLDILKGLNRLSSGFYLLMYIADENRLEK